MKKKRKKPLEKKRCWFSHPLIHFLCEIAPFNAEAIYEGKGNEIVEFILR